MKTTSAKSAQPKIELLPPSITLRMGRRRLTLSWRARKPLPSLLSTLLRRSWRQVLAPVLKVSVAAAAVCGAWQTQALAAAPAPGTLPTGWSVVNGNVVFTQNGNTLNINQLSPQAIANFLSFSIGSDAAVNISQPGAAAAFLAKVTGGDISQIYGKLTAPGTVVLFNPNGVMVGAGGVVDVGRFVATTLNISNDDFLAGKLTFAKDRANVGAVENYGNITSATGGSVYLIGSSVTNGGIIKSPQGEVILAAGQSVTLADTATPGVTVNVTGSTGDVTNLGTITAEAGRIGIAAGLISNSGNISASSVVREGGRIFLRASNSLTTTATSNISADGTTGGNVVLNGGDKAYIDGDVSAVGTAGQGGFVDTSAGQLDVVRMPRVGSGGTWLIDPYDLIVSDVTSSPNTSIAGSSVVSSGLASTIAASTINTMLNANGSVILQTGGGGAGTGNIFVNSALNKATGGAASLTLKAENNIIINADIGSSNASGKLDLALFSNFNGSYNGQDHTAQVNGASINLNGGAMTVAEGTGNVSSNLSMTGTGSAGSSLILGMGGSLMARDVTLDNHSQLGASDAATVNITGTLRNGGTVDLLRVGTATIQAATNNGQLNVGGGQVTFNTALANSVTGVIALNDNANLVLQGGMSNAGTVQRDSGATNVVINAGANITNANTGTFTLDGGTGANLSFIGAGQFNNDGNLTLSANVSMASSLNNNATGNVTFVTDSLTSSGANVTLGGGMLNKGAVRFLGNFGSVNVSAASNVTNTVTGTMYFGGVCGTVNVSGAGQWINNGSMTLETSVGPAPNVNFTAAALVNNANLVVDAGSQAVSNLVNTATGNVAVSDGATLTLAGGASLTGNMTVAAASKLVLQDATLNAGLNVTGAGDMSWRGNTTLAAPVTLGASAPTLHFDDGVTTAYIQAGGGNGANTLTTRNQVRFENGASLALDLNTTWVNYGTIRFATDLVQNQLTMSAGSRLQNMASGVINLSESDAYGTIMMMTGSRIDNYGTMNLGYGRISAVDYGAPAVVYNAANGTINAGHGTVGNGQYPTDGEGGLGNYGGVYIDNAGQLNVDDASLALYNNVTGQVNVSGHLTANDFQNDGNLTLQNGASVTGLSSNFGTITLGNSASLGTEGFSSLDNYGTLSMGDDSSVSYARLNNYGLVQGTGTFVSNAPEGGGFFNNGTVQPGGVGQVGTLHISGLYRQYEDGKLVIDIAGPGSYDVLDVQNGLYVGGTLQTNMLNGYPPTASDVFTIFGSGTGANGYFRYIDGAVYNQPGGKAMLKPTYSWSGAGFTLSLKYGEDFVSDISLAGGDALDWGNSSTWVDKGYVPTAVDRVTISSGTNVSVGSGRDVVDSLTVASGGALTVNGSMGVGNLTVDNGSLTGAAGSKLNVSESYTQSGGAVTLADAALSQSSGTLSVGNITADNLVLEAQAGNIRQQSGSALHVTTQLLASASTGIDLSAGGNQIAALAAVNRGAGNIAVVNTRNAADTGAVTLNGIRTAAGSISVDNTGGTRTAALGSGADFLADLPSNTSASTSAKLAILGITDTSGAISAGGGSVSLVTHSPLTIGAGGVNASGNIVLVAGASSASNDILTINGLVASQGGNITLTAGDGMTINANISTSPPGIAVLSVLSGAVIGYAQGVTITDANGVRTPVGGSSLGQSLVLAQQQQNTQAQNLQTTINAAQLASGTQSTTNAVQQTGSGSGQTAGGTSGNFGDESEGKKDGGKKPLPMCT